MTALLWLATLSNPAEAQGRASPDCIETQQERGCSRSRGHFISIGVNMALGGLTGGIGRQLRGDSFWRGFAAGAGGGALVYGGKQISTGRFRGAGIIGRQTSSVGNSIVANASAARHAFERIVLPIGIARVYLSQGDGATAHLRLDLAATVATLFFIADDRVFFDLNRSASAGSPVFVRRTRSASGGIAVAGVIRLREDTPDAMGAAFSHEKVHTVQTDFAFLGWGEPAEAWLVSKMPRMKRAAQHIDLRLDVALLGLANATIPYSRRPWEREATFLASKP